MVKMNGCAAIDSVRPFRFLADKAAVAADFHLGKWRLLSWETENSKHSRCMYTLRFCKNQLCRFCKKFEIFDLLAKMQSSVASRARRYPFCIFAVMLKHTWQAMHRGTHSCVLVGKHPKPFNNFREIGYAPLVLIF